MPTFEDRESLSSVRDKLNNAIILAETTAIDLELEKGLAQAAASQAQGYATVAQEASQLAVEQSWVALTQAEYDALPVKENNRLYLII